MEQLCNTISGFFWKQLASYKSATVVFFFPRFFLCGRVPSLAVGVASEWNWDGSVWNWELECGGPGMQGGDFVRLSFGDLGGKHGGHFL